MDESRIWYDSRMADRTRLHELDWLRVMAILVLLYFHSGMIFVSWEWHIKDPSIPPSAVLEYLMVWLHRWRMPLLLFISGAGSLFALGFRSPTVFLKERTSRLLVPLVFGMLVIVPPQIYIERIQDYESYWVFYPTIFEGIPYPQGNTSWHHLWFVAYLFCYSVFALPLMLLWRKAKSAPWRGQVTQLLSRPGGLLLLLLPSTASELILRRFWPDDRHSLIGDWACFTYYLLFFLAGYICCSERRIWAAIGEQRLLHLGIGLLAMIPMYLGYLSGPHPALSWGDLAVGGSKIVVAWCFVLAAIGYGSYYLAIPNRFLQEANRGIYPFYVLHQTAIVVIGYFVIPWSLGFWAKFILISTAAGVTSAGIYWLLIRPVPPIRWLFGLKPRLGAMPSEAPSQKLGFYSGTGQQSEHLRIGGNDTGPAVAIAGSRMEDTLSWKRKL